MRFAEDSNFYRLMWDTDSLKFKFISNYESKKKRLKSVKCYSKYRALKKKKIVEIRLLMAQI